eukprot:scaffold26224_cov63-Attheya_sp.AAC.4
MDERVERAATFLRVVDRSGKMTSSLAMQFAGFSATELCDHNLQRRVFRKKNSSPEGFSVTIPSTEYVKAKKQEICPISLASTASTASTTVSTFSGGFFFHITHRKVAEVDVFDIKASPCGKKGNRN